MEKLAAFRQQESERLLNFSRQSGSSLIEILVVVFVVVVVTAIGLPMIVSVTGRSGDYMKDERDTRMFSSISSAPQVARLDLIVLGDFSATIDSIAFGATAGGRPFVGQRFAVPGPAKDDRAGTSQSLLDGNEMLIYHGDE